MFGLINILKWLSVYQLLLIALSVLKTIAEKSKNKYDDEFVKFIENVIQNFKEYEKKIREAKI